MNALSLVAVVAAAITVPLAVTSGDGGGSDGGASDGGGGAAPSRSVAPVAGVRGTTSIDER